MSRKKVLASFNEDALYRLFLVKYRESCEKLGASTKGEVFDECARAAWKNLPISAIEGLIATYKINMAINKANQNLERRGAECKQCKTNNYDGKCNICKKKELNVKKVVGKREENKKKNCGIVDKKPCRKCDGKKDCPNRDKKKNDGNGKCKDNNGKCGEKKKCGNCANPKDNKRCGEKKDCGKGPDKKDGEKGGKKKDKERCGKKKDEGNDGKKKDKRKCADQESGEEMETVEGKGRGSARRKRFKSVERVADKKRKRIAKTPSSSASSSSYGSCYSSSEYESS